MGDVRRKTSEEGREGEFQTLEMYYRSLAEDFPGLVCRYGGDGTLEFVNDALCLRYGESRDELLGHNIFDRMPPEERETLSAALAELTPEKPRVVLTRENVSSDGSSCWERWTNRAFFDEAGSLTRVQAIGFDETEQVANKRALRDSNEHFRMLMEQSPLAIAIYDRAGVLVTANPAWCELWRISDLAQKIGKYNLLSDPLAEGLREDIQLAMNGQIVDVPERHLELFETALEPRYLRTRMYPLRGASGCVDLMVAMSEEVTKLRQAQIEARSLIADLENKNAEMEHFAYRISHDLKTPLITISGYLGLLARDSAAENHDRMHSDIDTMRRTVESMDAQLVEVLKLSRIGRIAENFVRVDINEVVHEVLRLCKGLIMRHEVSVTLSLPDDSPVVQGDPKRLIEVLQNLIENAVKYSKDKGEVRLEVGCRAEGGQLSLWVRDNGIGIDEAHGKLIFTIFQQIDPNREGSGIGLAMVKRIVEAHDGQIHVMSDGVGQGSVFTVTLSLSEGKIEAGTS